MRPGQYKNIPVFLSPGQLNIIFSVLVLCFLSILISIFRKPIVKEALRIFKNIIHINNNIKLNNKK